MRAFYVTTIEWTDATWNPTTGCSKVSPGCAHCYAETLSLRFGWSKKPWTPENAEENVVLHPERLDKPLRWRKPRRVFVNSMSDLFHELIPDDYIEQVFVVMARASQHTFQVLTKRPERALAFLSDPGSRNFIVNRATSENTGKARARGYVGMVEGAQPAWPLPNVWIGTSIENDRHAYRAKVLAQTPAAVRFISAEPLLGPLPSLDLSAIDWLIVGGESGPHHRPIDEAWVRELLMASRTAGTAFFFKQWGGRTPKAGGRELDGRTWDEYPHEQHELPEMTLV